MSEMRASILLQLIDRMSGPAKLATRAVENMNRAGRGIKDWARDANDRFEAMEERLAKLGQMTFVFDQMKESGRALTSVLGVTTGAAMSFEDAMAEVQKVADFKSPADLKTFERDLRRLATIRGMPAVDQLAEIAAAGAQQGIPVDELIDFVRTTAQASTAFDMMAGDAGSSIGTLRRNFKLTNDQVNQLLGSINELGNNTGAAAQPIIDVLERAGVAGQRIDLTAQQVAALGATMVESGADTAVAGTALNAFFSFMELGEKRNKKFNASLGRLGIDAEAFAKQMDRNPNRALTDFLEAVSESQDQSEILFDLFGAEYANQIGLLANGFDGLRRNQKLAGDQTAAQTSLQQEFEAAAAKTSSSLKAMRQALADVFIVAGKPFLKFIDMAASAVTSAARVISGFIDRFPLLSSVILGAVGVLGGLLVTVGTIGTALITTAGFVSLMGWSLSTLGFRAIASGGALNILTFGLYGVAKAALISVLPALKAVTLFMLTNPIGLVITAIAAGAALIILNWDKVKKWFGAFLGWAKKWGGKAVEAFKTAFSWTPLGFVIKHWTPIKTFFKALFNALPKVVEESMARIGRFLMGPINRLKEMIGLKKKAEMGLSDEEAYAAGQGIMTALRMHREGRLPNATQVPLAGLDAASGTPPPAMPNAVPSRTSTNNNTFNITQMPGESAEALARRVAELAARKERGALYDGE